MRSTGESDPHRSPGQKLESLGLDRLRQLGGDELLRSVIDLFLSHAGPKIEGLRGWLEAGNLDELERAAHSVRSSAANLGADELCAVAAEVERLAGERRRDQLAARIPAMESAFERLRGSLEEARKALSG